MTSRKYVSIFVARIKLYYIAFAKSLVAKRQKEGMLYPAVAHWNSKCFWEIVRRRIQLATTNIIATAIVFAKKIDTKILCYIPRSTMQLPETIV